MNKLCKSKRAFIELRRELCVSFGVYWCELWTETRCVILSVLLSIFVIMHVAVRKLPFDQHTLCTGIHRHFPPYTCGSTTVNVRSTHVMYRYSPSLPTIYNYHPPPLIISILPRNVIAVHHTQKTDTQTVPATVQLHYVLHRKVS